MLDDFRLPHAHGIGGSRMMEFRSAGGLPQLQSLVHRGAAPVDDARDHDVTGNDAVASGGSYDRPIARRILEEAGVPRGIFGVTKRASAYYHFGLPRI